MSKTIIGIDVGKHGALVVMNPAGQVFTCMEMPMIKSELDYKELAEVFKMYTNEDLHVVFEKLGVIFGTSKSTAFSMGHQAGAVEMLCVALDIPFTKVPPKVWQKEMFMGITEISKASKSGKSKVRDTKAMALLAAKQIFPNQRLTLGLRAIKPHDGLVDALLIAEYGRRKL